MRETPILHESVTPMKQSDDLVFIYTTLPGDEAAAAIARALVEQRLAACCNILPPMLSVYRWDGAVQAEPETAMLIKTRRALADAAIAAATKLHPYDVPCFLTLPIETVSAAYLQWALGEAKP